MISMIGLLIATEVIYEPLRVMFIDGFFANNVLAWKILLAGAILSSVLGIASVLLDESLMH